MSSNHPAESGKPEQLHLEESSIANNDGCIDETSFDKDGEKRLLRKLDWHIVPILWLIYMLAFLDRTNVCLVETYPSAGAMYQFQVLTPHLAKALLRHSSVFSPG
jgi:hypothetical protein